jgi:hypothetical protein
MEIGPLSLNDTNDSDSFPANIRKRHPRAYEKWTHAEEKQLLELHERGETIQNMAEVLGRQHGGVRSRLQRLGVIESSDVKDTHA